MSSITRFAAAVIFSSVLSASGASQVQNAPAFDAAAVEAKASNGDVASMVQLGRAYWYGNGVTPDMEKGRVWLGRAAEKGSVDAQMLLGAAYLSGTKLSKDPQLAAKYLLQVAQLQHVEDSFKSSQALAQFWVSLMYEQGSGVEKSHEKAIQFLEMAANNGSSPAQFDLAALYNDGTGGISMDKVHACDLYEKAADQGHVMAMHNVAYCYQVGSGGKKDENKAIYYYTKAAEGGSVRAQRNLGVLFGREAQFEKAYFWLRVADASGDTELQTLIEKVKPTLSPAQVENTEKEITAWLNAHPPKKKQ